MEQFHRAQFIPEAEFFASMNAPGSAGVSSARILDTAGECDVPAPVRRQRSQDRHDSLAFQGLSGMSDSRCSISKSTFRKTSYG
jgi:hypothetical protein